MAKEPSPLDDLFKCEMYLNFAKATVSKHNQNDKETCPHKLLYLEVWREGARTTWRQNPTSAVPGKMEICEKSCIVLSNE